MTYDPDDWTQDNRTSAEKEADRLAEQRHERRQRWRNRFRNFDWFLVAFVGGMAGIVLVVIWLGAGMAEEGRRADMHYLELCQRAGHSADDCRFRLLESKRGDNSAGADFAIGMAAGMTAGSASRR